MIGLYERNRDNQLPTPAGPVMSGTGGAATRETEVATPTGGTVGDGGLSWTESVCPQCLKTIPAGRVREGADVFLTKTCPEHGESRSVIWRGAPDYATWFSGKTPNPPALTHTVIEKGCPLDCGLCPEHRQQTCCVLLEVTARCDLGCPVCFASSGASAEPDPALTTIGGWYRMLRESTGGCNIQLSGGEPTMRDDLPEIITMGRDLGFTFFQLNTNGLRLASEPGYAIRLKEAGLSTVFLQFDGVDDAVYAQLRGRSLLAAKEAAIEHCAENGLGVILVPVLVPGVNTSAIGDIVRFALERAPVVRGIHFQPVSYFGRYPAAPDDSARITLPEVIHALETQTGGLVRADHFVPPGCENALCSFHGNFILMPDGRLIAYTHHQPLMCDCVPIAADKGAAEARDFVARRWAIPAQEPPATLAAGPSLGEWDSLLVRAKTHTFCISAMAFQDAWTLDLERLRDCCIHVVALDGHIIPFCAYNLTSRSGQSLYRGEQWI